MKQKNNDSLDDLSSFNCFAQSKSLQNDIFALVKMGLWQWNLSTDEMAYSPHMETLIGCDKDDVPKTIHEWEKVIIPDDHPGFLKMIAACKANHSEKHSISIRMQRKNGTIFWVQDEILVTNYDETANALIITGLIRDISSTKIAEQKLKFALAENERHNENLKIEVEHVKSELTQSLLQGQAMLEATPYPCLICDNDMRIVDCNPAAIKFFDFSSKQFFLENFFPFLLTAIPNIQPNGEKSISMKERLQFVKQNGYLEFETVLFINNIQRPVRAILKRINYKNSFAIAAYLIDLASIKEAKTELLHQDKLLLKINLVARKLLSSEPDNFHSVTQTCLQILGDSVHADRVALFCKTSSEDNSIKFSKLYEWAKNAKTFFKKEVVADVNNMPNFKKNVLARVCVNVPIEQLTFDERNFFSTPNAHSLLIIPIYWQDKFWGYLTFEDCKASRVFSEIEENLLQSGGILVVSGIWRNEATFALIDAKEAALQSAKSKSEFLSRMSHEIRTPMNAIIGMSTIAKSTSDNEKITHCLKTINTSSKQLLEIINDVLDMSKIEANKLELTPFEFDFVKTVGQVLDIAKVKIDEKSQILSVDFETEFCNNIFADELRLKQVLTNLLNNAVKFTPDGGHIFLNISHSPIGDDSSNLNIRVVDDGIGISKEQQEKLFNAFEQADNSITRRFGGTGLGLAISQKIINQMGGTIQIESELEKGAQFSFTVPIVWGGARKNDVVEMNFLDNLSVLVIDDSPDVLVFFQNILQNFNMNCDIASNGDTGVSLVKKRFANNKIYDIIFIDWNMFGLSGFQTIKEIQALRSQNNQPLITIISVSDWFEIEPEAKKIGINLFLPKPILPSALYDFIIKKTSLVKPFSTQSKPFNLNSCGISFANKTILLAEDIDINREIILSLLENTQINIDCAVNGKEAVDMFENNPKKYSAILMDVQMPEMDGLTATQLIRNSKQENAKSIPIIAMTANALKEDVETCLRAGMNDHVAKPIDIEILLNKMVSYLDGVNSN